MGVQQFQLYREINILAPNSPPLAFFAIQNLFSNYFPAKTVSRTEKCAEQKL